MALALLLAGCDTLPEPAAAAEEPVALAVPAFEAPQLVLAGFTVEHFRWHSDLTSWVHSRQLLERAAGTWLQVPDERILTIRNPDRAALRQYLTRVLPARVKPAQTVLFYMGTHQLADGRILLADEDAVSAGELVEWLREVPAARVVLAADICFARSLEQATGFGPTTMRLYASLDDEAAPNILLTRRIPAAQRYFADTQAVIQRELRLDHESYSLFGYLLVHAMHQQRQRGATELRADRLFEIMEGARAELAPQVKQLKFPAFAERNAQPWVLAVAPVAAGASVAALPHPPAAARAESVPALLRVPRSQLDPAYANLLIGQQYDPEVKIDPYLSQVDEMAAELRGRIGKERRPAQVMAIVNDYLFRTLKLHAVEEPYPTDFLLHELLRERRGRCTALVSLYQALGWRLGMELRGVCIPEHIFIRWVREADDGWAWPRGQHYLNVETTREGAVLPDARYERLPNWDMTPAGQGFYLQPLDARGTTGALLAPLANALLAEERLDDARAIGKLAVEAHPGDAEAWNILGSVYRRQGEAAAARTAYEQALKVHPGFAEAWNNLGAMAEDHATQVDHYRKALSLKPELGEAWANLARAYAAEAQHGLAWAAIQRARQYGYALPNDFIEEIRSHLKQ